jgi:hypothetical protein
MLLLPQSGMRAWPCTACILGSCSLVDLRDLEICAITAASAVCSTKHVATPVTLAYEYRNDHLYNGDDYATALSGHLIWLLL